MNKVPTRIDLPKEELEHLYYKEKLSLKTVGEHFGVSDFCVQQNMKRFGLKTRDLSDSHKGQHSSPKTEFKLGQKPAVNGFEILKKKRKRNGAFDSELLMIDLLNKNKICGYTREYKIFTGDQTLGGRRFYAIDFAWVDKKIAVEVDGNSHDKRTHERDERKDAFLKKRGWKIVRFTDYKIKSRGLEVIEKISDILGVS